jgi:fatty acid desaturase
MARHFGACGGVRGPYSQGLRKRKCHFGQRPQAATDAASTTHRHRPRRRMIQYPWYFVGFAKSDMNRKLPSALEFEMPSRLRKFIGSILLLVLVTFWALLAMALAQSVLTDINGFVAVIFYVVAGLGWVLPAMPLISWMAKGDKAKV